MKIYKIVKREENPTIRLSDVSFNNGFIIVTANFESVGIIVQDCEKEEYIFIHDFYNTFIDGIDVDYRNESVEELMKELKSDYMSPVEFNFIKFER